MREITRNADMESIAEITAFVEAFLEQHGCTGKVQMQIDIAIDEICSNIARYAYPAGGGTMTVGIEWQKGAVCLTFTDSGIPYNPLEREDPDIHLSAEERGTGGLGIYMVKKSMDEVLYAYRDGRNCLTIKKYI